MYQKIVEGYSNETRKVYTCDDSESGKRRLLTMDEELEKLNKGFEELIKWDQMVAKSQKQNAEKQAKISECKIGWIVLYFWYKSGMWLYSGFVI